MTGRRKHKVTIAADEREYLWSLVYGKSSKEFKKRAHMLLLADEGEWAGERRSDKAIAGIVGSNVATVERVRRNCVMEGLQAALEREKQMNRKRPVRDGEGEARLVALSCSEPPAGFASWTLSMLADRLVELKVVESISPETVRKSLKKDLQPWKTDYYCIPARRSAEFVDRMEDVLDACCRSYGDDGVLVCKDEMSKQQTLEVAAPIEARPGRPEIRDFEYVRNGVSSLFMFYAPLENWRRVDVTDRRTKLDWAGQIRKLPDEDFPGKSITPVMDNLNTHSKASLFEAFDPEEARRIKARISIVHTPKHGSWLNMAEIEIGVMSRQCLRCRMPDQAFMKREVAAWQNRRNAANATVEWHFTTEDARIKLKSLYPVIQAG